ncbi:MAG: DUF2892 domain-containing protein [Bacteroidia bacterium]|nr:DUF2892 domain-containing protein [Bacteroidia bacterium]MDW8134160.1 DUF2892 domain-containing protein [Bacteroidia bacterium]
MRLEQNVGNLDKVIRSILGGLLVGLGFYESAWWLIVAGLVMALTAILGRCGLYYLFGISTCKRAERR